MKLRVLLLSALVCSLSFSYPSFAKSYGYRLPKTPRYGSTYSRTHSVRSYVRKDGTFVQGHLAGNPRSGVHCHDNVCY